MGDKYAVCIRDILPSDFYPQSPQLTTASKYRRYLRAF